MTEKRFVPIGVEWTDGFIQDHIGDRDLFSIGAVCNLLNDLSEENEQLKKEIERLRKENNELKTELFEVSKELLWATSDEVDRVLYYEDEVEELRKEIFK